MYFQDTKLLGLKKKKRRKKRIYSIRQEKKGDSRYWAQWFIIFLCFKLQNPPFLWQAKLANKTINTCTTCSQIPSQYIQKRKCYKA